MIGQRCGGVHQLIEMVCKVYTHTCRMKYGLVEQIRNVSRPAESNVIYDDKQLSGTSTADR